MRRAERPAAGGRVVVVVGTGAGPQVPQSGVTVIATDGFPVVASRAL